MAEHKKQHYLPEFYLKGFSKAEQFGTGESNVLWRYSKEEKDIKQKSIQNTGHLPYLYSFKKDSGEYDHSVEEKLSQIEGQAKLVITKIEHDIDRVLANLRVRNPIFPPEKWVLITFLFFMMKRVPAVMDDLFQGIEKIAIEMEAKFKTKAKEDYKKQQAIQMFLDLGMSKDANIPRRLFDKNMAICYIPPNVSTYITIDNPFVTWRKAGSPGIVYDDTEIYLPLSSKCLLLLHGVGGKIDLMRYADRKTIYRLNKYIASHAYKMVISRDKELLVKIIKALKWEVKE